MINKCGVYKIFSKKLANRCYIGSSINIQNRWKKHIRELKANKHHSVKLQRHFNKYGIDDLEFTILVECDKKELLNEEQSFLDNNFPYFNTNKKAGCANNGIPWNKGKKMRIPAWNKDRKMNEQQRLSMIGHIVSDETKKKISKSKAGVRYKITDGILERNKKLCVSVLQFNMNGILIKKYNSLKETTLDGFVYQHVSSCCRGKRKSTGGYMWRYENDVSTR